MARERHVLLDLPTEPQAPSVAFTPYNPGIVKTLVGLHCILDRAYWTPPFAVGFEEVFRIQYMKKYGDGRCDIWLTRMNGQHAGVLTCDPIQMGVTFVRLVAEEPTTVTVTVKRWCPVLSAVEQPFVAGEFVLHSQQLHQITAVRPNGDLNLAWYRNGVVQRARAFAGAYGLIALPSECVRYARVDIPVVVPIKWGTFLGQVVAVGEQFEDTPQICLVVGESEVVSEYGRQLTMIELDADPQPTVITTACNVTLLPDYDLTDNPLAMRHGRLLQAAVKLREAVSSVDGVKLVEGLMRAVS